MRHRHLSVFGFCIALWLLLVAAASAFTPQLLHDDSRLVDLTSQVSYATGSLPSAMVLAGRAKFAPAPPAPGGSTQTIWLRVPLTADRHAHGPWILSLPHSVTQGIVYIPFENSYRRIAVGSGLPFARKSDAFVLVSVAIDRTALGPRPLYLRVTYQSGSPLWLRAQTLRSRIIESFLFRLIDGLFFGILLAVGLCNLYVACAVRDRSAAWFVAYVGALIANEIVTKGLGSAYFWPNLGLVTPWPAVVTGIACFGTFLGFTRTFLQTQGTARLWDKLLIAAFALVAISDVVANSFFGGQPPGLAVLAFEFAAIVVAMGAGIARMRAGYHPARFFVLAFVPAAAGIIVNLAYNIFAPAGDSFLASNGIEFGVMAECVILSFSLLDRIRTLDAQRAKTEAELVRAAQRNVELTTLATRDPLTGISNRLAFFETLEDEIEYAQRTGLMLGVLYVDLDDFKGVNDRFGHRVGDILLQIFSRRLKNAVRPADSVARLGGDEFAVLVTGLHDPSVLDAVQNNVVHILDTHITIEGALINVGMSVGAAIFPRDGTEADALIEAADHRMYYAKQRASQAADEGSGTTISPA